MASLSSSGPAPAQGPLFSNLVPAEKSKIILLIALVILVLVLIIIWIIFTVKNSNLKGTIVIGQPIKLATLQTPNVTADASLPVPKIGREFTYSMWLYLEDFVQTTGVAQPYKMIFYRGTDPNSVTYANPVVFMDPVTNKLYFVLKTVGSQLSANGIFSGKPIDPLSGIIANNYFLNTDTSLYISTPPPNTDIVLSVDYIPLQKWVNVIVAVNDKLMTTFVDGEIYSVKGVDEVKATRSVEYNNGVPVTYNLMVDKSVGDITVGASSFNQTTIDGYVSNLAYYNYALSLSDVKSVYSAGPITSTFPSNLLKYIGLGTYGIRSPVYSLTSASASDATCSK